MGVIIKISKKNTVKTTRAALEKLVLRRTERKVKKLSNFYGKMPGLYEDGLIYQKKLRNDWD